MNRIHLKTPLYTALQAYAEKQLVHFDVPGHKKRNCSWITEAFGDRVLALDANSTKELDMLSKPTGPIKEAEQLMALAYGSDQAFFLVNGSTSGVQYMIMAACRPNEKIIMPRNVHRSAINALILSGAVPVFIEPEIDLEFGISNGVSLKTVQQAVRENPDAKALFLMHPTYFGVVSDLKQIIEYAHDHDLVVVIDEAHGAHFPFHPDLPANAMSLNADMATVSIHKTAGSLTQSSVLLLNERKIKKHDVRTIVNLMQTSSASYLLMASLDLARRQLAINGLSDYQFILHQISKAKKALNQLPGIEVMDKAYTRKTAAFDYDETKFVVKVNGLGLSGFEVYDILFNKYNIQVELAESYVILAIIGVGDDNQTIFKLVEALQDIAQRYYGQKKKYEVNLSRFFKIPMMELTPREAHYHKKLLCNIKDSVGKVSGESIMIYPPGIPLVMPGEIISAEIVSHYQFYRSQGCVMVNDQDNPGLIKVVDK